MAYTKNHPIVCMTPIRYIGPIYFFQRAAIKNMCAEFDNDSFKTD